MSRSQKNNDSPEDIIRRRDAGIRKALNTPPKPNKELVGTTERAQITKDNAKYRKNKRDT